MKRRQSKNKKEKSHIPSRLNLLFFIVFVLFIALIFRLGYLQIIRGQDFAAEVARTETTIAAGNVPRGEIYDASNRKLVGNQSKPAITYTRGQGVSSEEIADVAENLAKLISMPSVSEIENPDDFDISIRDMKDYYISKHTEEINDRLSDEDKQLSGSEFYDKQLEAVTEEELRSFTEEDREATAIFKEMNSGYALSTINIKNEEVSSEEIARVNESLSLLPGVSTGADWERVYPQGSMLRSVLGAVSTEDQGIPEEEAGYYLAQGYSRNDRIGQSFLEQEYESVLKGTKSRSYTETNSGGEVVNQTEIYPGKKGSNLVLSLDLGYQATLEAIAEDYVNNHRMGLNNSIYIAALDPNNGDILGLVGKKYNESQGEIQDDALGTFTGAYEVGSVIKGATILAGYMDGVLNAENNVMVDAPLKVQGTNIIRSVFNPNGSEAVNDITALEVSSNIYMSKIAMRMGGVYSLEYNQPLTIDAEMVLGKLRRYFAMFGLGAETGIDLPGEQTGYKGPVSAPGQVLYYSFGQYDSYTTLQLAQYASVIANGGTRYAPQLVSEIRDTNEEGQVGAVEAQNEPKVLNTVSVSDTAMDRVQEGFRRVAHGSRGTARNAFGGAPYEIGAKTGTAEALYFGEREENRGDEVLNRTFVGYAPHDDPEIAIAIMVPYMPERNSNFEINNVARRIFDAHFQVGDYEGLSQTLLEEYPIEDLPEDLQETMVNDENEEATTNDDEETTDGE